MINIDDKTRRLSQATIVVGYKQENKAESIEFEIPKYLKEYGKKICFKTKDGKVFSKLFDNTTSNIFTFTRTETQYGELNATIEFFKTENEDMIIYKTSMLHIIFNESIICEDEVQPDEPKIPILESLIEKTTDLNNIITENEETRNNNENTRISNENERKTNENERETYYTNIQNKVNNGEFNGKDATINGKNSIEIEAGNNIDIEETENGIKINSTGSGTGGGAVDSVNGQTGEVWLGAEDVGALPNTTKIPTKTSDLNNDSGFIDTTYHDNTKVDKEEGKGLSTNDFTNEEKEKLSQLENYNDTQLRSDINTIKEKIPTQATNNNQLADKDFVNSSLNSITAFYITKNADGNQFNSKSELDSATEFYSGSEVRVPTRNDYCIVLEDETKDNSTTRYIYQNNQWEFQYIVNETPLTSEQIKAINSGITLELVSKLQGIDLTNVVRDADYVHTDNNYTNQEKTKLAGLNNYDDTEIRQKLDNKVDNGSFVYDEETETLSITI